MMLEQATAIQHRGWQAKTYTNIPQYTVRTIVINCHAGGGHTHISKEIAGDLRPSYIPVIHINTHIQAYLFYTGASKKLSDLSSFLCTVRHIKTGIKAHVHREL